MEVAAAGRKYDRVVSNRPRRANGLIDAPSTTRGIIEYDRREIVGAQSLKEYRKLGLGPGPGIGNGPACGGRIPGKGDQSRGKPAADDVVPVWRRVGLYGQAIIGLKDYRGPCNTIQG